MANFFTKKIIWVIVILAVIAGISSYFLFFKNKTSSITLFPLAKDATSNKTDSQSARSDLPTTEPSVNLPNGLVEYKNSYYKFKLNYSSNLSVSEFAENGGGRTILFEDNKNSDKKGFQIFITPYKYTQITQERFEMDEPSGVIGEQTEIIIDGLHAIMFYSNNGIMGDTREVWFINNGFLYEVVTYKDLDSWLSEIMATWKFTL